MDPKYEKREGTAAMSGQLYEINLISLISFRLQHDADIEVLHLASNMARSGSFDDICFRVNIKQREHPLLVFIQAKHKENEETSLNYDLIKHFYASYVEVKQKFSSCKDVFFKGKFEDAECVFILYTNAKYYNDTNNVLLDRVGSNPAAVFKPYQSDFSNKLNQLIATGDADSQGYQTDLTDKDLEYANEKILEEEISTLAEHYAKFFNDKPNQSMHIMNDKYMVLYHVLLSRNVVNISEVKFNVKKTVQWRIMTFKPDFFNSEDHILIILRKKLCELIFKTQVKKNNYSQGIQRATSKDDTAQSSVYDESTVDKLILSFLSEPSALTLSTLIRTFIIYKNGNLHFTVERPNSDVQKLEEINILQSTVNEAEEIAARNILLSFELKVPVTFGNLDLTLGGSSEKNEKRLNILADILFKLCQKSMTAVIDETVGEGYLALNNGIGSAVGNLLVYDNDTKFLKFTESPVSLPKNAKSLYDKLNSKIEHLDTYRFDVRPNIMFPKLIFNNNYNDEAKHILNKVVIYDKQSNHNGVEAILKKEIEHHRQTHGPHDFLVKSDTVVTKYHKIIQKWWMSPKTGTYITKSNNIYKEAITDIMKEPQISAMQATFRINNLNYITYNFSKTATESLASLKVNTKTIISTDIAMLTTLKVIQFYRSICVNGYVVLDLDSILNLPTKDFDALISELKSTENLLIVVCESIKSIRILHKRLDEVAEATENKKVVVITNDEFDRTVRVQEYFPNAALHKDLEQSLNDFSPETQKFIMQNTKVIFQGEEVNLDLLVNTNTNNNNLAMCEALIKMIKGTVLNEIVRNGTIKIGQSLSNSSYEKIKHLYVDRRVREVSGQNTYNLKNLYDIKPSAVIIAAEAGMGKSTLLTHLSLKTKEIVKDLWIVRINLLDYTKMFKKWQDDKTDINTLEAIKFMCQVVLDNNELVISLKENNSKIYLETYTGDEETNNNEWSAFVLSMFLHYYNERKLLFLFDGFDEICPHYINIAITFISVVKEFPGEHKMWVTSRPYSNILPDLQNVICNSYQIEYLNYNEQATYLENIWKDKLTPETIGNDQLAIIEGLIQVDTFSKFVDWHFYKEFSKLFEHLYNYARLYILQLNLDTTGYVNSSNDNLNSNRIIYTTPLLLRSKGREVMGTPLLLYLLGNHIVNVIYSYKTSNEIKKTNLLTIYDIFIQTQMDEIRFQVKNKMDTSKPDVTTMVDKERLDCINLHKKLGAHALLDDIFNKYNELNKDMLPFSGKQSSEMNAMLDLIKSGREKTGLISHVTADNIPVFVHKTFAEYFASEFLCDIFKSEKFEMNDKRLLYSFLRIYSHQTVYMYWIEKRIEIDNELVQIIKTIRSSIIGLCINEDMCNLLSYALLVPPDFKANYMDNTQLLRIFFSSAEDYVDNDFINFINDKSKEIAQNILGSSDVGLSTKLTYVCTFIEKYFVGKMKPRFKKYFAKSSAVKTKNKTLKLIIGTVQRSVDKIKWWDSK